MIPLKINNKHLIEIMDPTTAASLPTDAAKIAKSLELGMYPSEVKLTSETYSKDAERTANYELEDLVLVNRKDKPEFTWDYIKASYVENLLAYLGYHFNFKITGSVVPENAPVYVIEYKSLIGMRAINAYLGQTISATLIETTDGEQYWTDFRIAFPEV